VATVGEGFLKNYRPYKFVIVPVLQEVDEDDRVIRELAQQEPTTVFGIDGLHAFANSFEFELATRIEQKTG